MSRETQTVLLFLLGLATGVMVVKGTYVHYVKPSMMPWLVLAAVVMIALAIVSAIRDIRTRPADNNSHRGWMVWLLLVPVAVTAFVIPPPIGARGATPEVAAASQPQKRAFPPLPSERAPTVSLPELMMRAATDSAGTLNDRLITVTGFTIKGGSGPELGRVVIVCCAADAQLARVHLDGPAAATAADFPEDTWLRVEGTVVPGSSNAATSFVPTMRVTSMAKIDRPANTYAYPR
ncbi:TIGR03943 family putative permease subunit [Mycobacterium sp.]|jgi:putative membrane protein|uniref:TIGR03943 family putative permease subunit n=1 Tax=Mycobacterium sp. TaxID=1785 RepID=UPI002D3DC28C|nr:TIGR03943 family protein [Mycobacterium sp.]HZA12316.1 TIGR03943 family protein [Mycobacterium sp.]